MTHERIMTGEEYVSYSDYLSLERERDEARHKLELCMAANSDVARIAKERDEWRKKFELSVDAVEIAARLARAESERDEARADLAAEIKHHWDTIIKIACKLELEHDELREKNAKLSDIAERAIDCVTHTDDCRHLIAELDQLKEGAK